MAKSVLYFLSMPTTKFVAVQLLAGFEEVRMPCHYRTGASWKDFFGKLGYQVIQTGNIGFPANRDIAVPQGFFVF